MTFTSSILNIAKSGLAAQQSVIAATSSNITNVNTEGYTRRRVSLVENASQQVGLAIGRGVKAESVERLGDEFLEKVLRTSIGEKELATIKEEMLSRAQTVFDITGDVETIGSALESFFGSLSDLTVSPADLELRANVLQQATSLTNTINRSYRAIADLQREADERIVVEIEAMNEISQELAGLNGEIRRRESSGQVAGPERDRRDQLLKDLAEIVEVEVIEDNTSQILVYLPNGFNLVSGVSHNELEVSKAPTFLAGSAPPALDGGPLNFIVYDYDSGATEEHIDLTALIGQGTGRLSGLLEVRGIQAASNTSPFQADGELVEIASQIEAISRTLLTEVNQVYLGVDQNNLASNSGNPLLNDENGAGGYDASSGYLDSTGTPQAASLFGLFDFAGAADTVGGTIAGLPDAADLVNLGINDFSTLIKVAVTDKDQIANARDLDAAANSLSFFTGDSSNIEELVKLRDQKFTNVTVGNFTMNSTLGEAYQGVVTDVSAKVMAATSNKNIATSTQISAQEQRDSNSGVSLDEEFSNLIRFQRAFEASARMIRVADEMLQTIIDLV